MEYIKEYTTPTPAEKRQLFYKRQFKKQFPQWDDTLIRLTDLFAATIPKKKISVLDVGCGNGNWVIDELRDRIGYAVGQDIDESATLKNKCLDKVVIGDLENAAFKPDEFDAATALWVFEHLEDPEKILRQTNRLLKPSGIFAFVTPNKNNFLILFRRFINVIGTSIGDVLVTKLYGREKPDIFPTFYRANDVATVKKLAKKTGFSVEVLTENFDPSYTSFNTITYKITCWLYKLQLSIFRPHLLVILRKNV